MRAVTREIWRLAVPAFGALIAEPVFLLIDSAVVGHLGTAPLAGLGVASGVLLTIVGTFVFLAYGTTAAVARRLGAGDVPRALAAGVDGLWLAGILGVVFAVAAALAAHPLVAAFGASAESTGQATIYLRICALGIPAMFVVMAATGVLRGLQDTRTPLVVAIVGAALNAFGSWLLVHPVGLGIAGAAWATVGVQLGMAATLLWVVVRGARREHAPVRFDLAGIVRAGAAGLPLLIRTLALRAVVLLTTWVAAGLGDAPLAAHQVAMTVWSSLAFALDALAIAAQAITGKALGAGDVAHARDLTTTLVRWGIVYGLALAALIVAVHRVIPGAFTRDPAVAAALAAALLVVAAGQPVAGVAFVLDGVLIGAGDAKWLAFAQVAFLLAYLPMVLGVRAAGVTGTAGLVWLWVAFTGFMTVRAVGLWLRSRTDAWLVTGV